MFMPKPQLQYSLVTFLILSSQFRDVTHNAAFHRHMEDHISVHPLGAFVWPLTFHRDNRQIVNTLLPMLPPVASARIQLATESRP